MQGMNEEQYKIRLLLSEKDSPTQQGRENCSSCEQPLKLETLDLSTYIKN